MFHSDGGVKSPLYMQGTDAALRVRATHHCGVMNHFEEIGGRDILLLLYPHATNQFGGLHRPIQVEL